MTQTRTLIPLGLLAAVALMAASLFLIPLASKTKALGLHYQIPNPPASLKLDVEVLEHHKIVKNRELVQTMICGRFPHQVQPSGYPQDMLAVVDSKSIQLQPGHYQARLRKIEGSAYAVELVKKSEAEVAPSVSTPV